MSQALQTIIDQAWENRGNLSPQSAPTDIKQAVSTVLEGLNNGSIRVAERQSVGKWNVNQWVKKAVLLSAALLLAACGNGNGSSTSSGLAGYGGLPAGQKATYTYVEPYGTAVRIERGYKVDIMPVELDVKGGESIRVINQIGRAHV